MSRLAAAGPLPALDWREWAARYPEWWSLALSAGAWLMLLGHNATADPGALCLGAHIHAGAVSVAWRSGVLGGMLVTCLLMVVAMVPVLAVPLVRHVSARTFPGRRDGAVAFFLGGSVCVWLLVGVTVTFAVAAIWQFTPAKRRALLRCHRTVPLAPMGWQSDRDCFLFGASHGAGCVASCWAMMLAVMVAGHDPIMTLCVQGVALAERRSRLPWVRGSALLLLACGTVVLFHTGL